MIVKIPPKMESIFTGKSTPAWGRTIRVGVGVLVVETEVGVEVGVLVGVLVG